MSPSDLLLAVTLLSAPVGSPTPVLDQEEWPNVRSAIHQIGVEWQILDQREVRFLLLRLEDFDNDLTILRRRYQDLKDAPVVEDCVRFPDRNQIAQLLTFNRNYRKYLEDRLVIEKDRTAELQTVIRETDRLYYIWDAIRDARCEFYYVTVRRAAMKRLRETVGDDVYYSQELPPAAPLWRFPEIQ